MCALRRDRCCWRPRSIVPTIGAHPGDLAFVDLTLVDGEGALHGSADRQIHVEVDGPGVLQALGSANPASTEGFTGTSCTTFDGRALAVIRPTGAGGDQRDRDARTGANLST